MIHYRLYPHVYFERRYQQLGCSQVSLVPQVNANGIGHWYQLILLPLNTLTSEWNNETTAIDFL